VLVVGTHLDDPMCTQQHVQILAEKMKRYKSIYKNLKDVFFVSLANPQGLKEFKNRLVELALQQKILTNLVPQSYHVSSKLIRVFFETKY